MDDEKLEGLIFDIEKASSEKTLEIIFKIIKKSLDENTIDQSKFVDLFMDRILFANKKNNKIIKLKEKDDQLMDKIIEILNKINQKSYVLEKFLDHFQQESFKNFEENKEILKRNFISSLFIYFISDENLDSIIQENFQTENSEIQEIQMNKLLKLPLVFSNFSQNISEKFNSDNYYKKIIKLLQTQKNFKNNTAIVIHFLNKITFNGLLGKTFNLILSKIIEFCFKIFCSA